MRNVLPGLKTNLNTIVLGLLQVAMVAGVSIEPEATVSLIKDWWGVAVSTPIGLIFSGIWFRYLAK